MHIVVISRAGGNVICSNLGPTELMSGAALEQEAVQAVELAKPGAIISVKALQKCRKVRQEKHWKTPQLN